MLRGLYYTAIRNREKSLSLGWALERAARLYPDNPAVLDGQRRISYALFNGWANRLARAFKAEGVGHGSVVAVMLENRVELLAILAALAKLGAIGALVNTTQRGKVPVHSLNLVKPGHFVVGEELREVFEEVRQEVLRQRRPLLLGRRRRHPRRSRLAADGLAQPDAPGPGTDLGEPRGHRQGAAQATPASTSTPPAPPACRKPRS